MKKIKKTGAGGEIYSNTEADKLSECYGVDIADELSAMLSADELSAMLSAEIANSIDVEILKSLGVLSTPERRKRSMNKIYKKN
jgi:predicted nucleic acid-binding protein